MAKQRVSSTSITGVAPVTIYQDSPDALFLDASKYRTAVNTSIARFNSSNLLSSDTANFESIAESAVIESTNVPNLEDISVDSNVTYVDTNSVTKAKITFKINNPDSQKITGVDILISVPSIGGNS